MHDIEKMGGVGGGQGQSHEKIDKNRHISAITSGYKKGVKCQQDNNCPKASKTTICCYLQKRKVSILVNLYKQKSIVCVC